MANGKLTAMKDVLTIDAAGRIVLPKPVRRHFRLGRGSKLRLRIGSDGILLVPQQYPPPLTQEGGLLVHEGEPMGDLVLAVEAVRDQRNRQVSGGVV
jgi:AbrB family looped-hinge helix DNA binding protein